MIRVLVVDDSLVARKWVMSCLSKHPGMKTIGEAEEGVQAATVAKKLGPDVIVMDMAMPLLNGVGATRRIMTQHPTPILIVSGSKDRQAHQQTMQALEAGAVDAFPKARSGEDLDIWQRRFLSKVEMVARAKAVCIGALPKPTRRRQPAPGDEAKIVALGAGMGGPQAVAALLRALPPLAVPVLVTVQITSALYDDFVAWLASVSTMPVKSIVEETPIDSLRGVVCVAASNRHLAVANGSTIHAWDGPPVNFCKPAIDVMFKSSAEVFGRGAVGILLTGSGRDGGRGLLSIRQAGGMTLAQDEASCTVFGMAKAAIALNAVTKVCSLASMPGEIVDQCPA